jgi:HK97 family phage major capsid protein
MLKQLLEKRASIFSAMQELRGKLGADGKFSPEDETKWEKMNSDWSALDLAIAQEKAWEERSREMASEEYENRQRTAGNTSHTGGPAQGNPENAYALAFEKYCRKGQSSLTPEEVRTLETRGTNTQITTTDSLGGYLVPTLFSSEMDKTLKHYGGVLEVARLITTSIGGTLEWPTVNDTAATGSIQTTEAGALTVADMTFGKVDLNAYTFTSDIVKLAYQLLNDESVGLQGMLAEMLIERIARNVNAKLTTGTGSGQPTGIVTASSLGVETASATALTMSELITLLHSVDRAYRVGPSVGWMMNDGVLAAIKKLAVGSSDANPLWLPDFRGGEPDRLLGYPVYINNDMAATQAAAAKSVLFGNFNKYVVRRVGGFNVQRLNELYAANLSVGFLAYTRLDGNLIASGAVKHLLNNDGV